LTSTPGAVIAVGCVGHSPDHMATHIHSTMAGRYSESTPTGRGSATWTGVMVGMETPAYITGLTLDHDWQTPGAQPDVYLGDARIVIDDLAAPYVDVSFTNIHNVTEVTKHRDLTWENLRVEDGVEAGSSPILLILGMFNGSQHQEESSGRNVVDRTSTDSRGEIHDAPETLRDHHSRARCLPAS